MGFAAHGKRLPAKLILGADMPLGKHAPLAAKLWALQVANDAGDLQGHDQSKQLWLEALSRCTSNGSSMSARATTAQFGLAAKISEGVLGSLPFLRRVLEPVCICLQSKQDVGFTTLFLQKDLRLRLTRPMGAEDEEIHGFPSPATSRWITRCSSSQGMFCQSPGHGWNQPPGLEHAP